MADFITKKENGRRLAIIILCCIVMAGAIVLGAFSLKKSSDLFEGEKETYNIKKMQVTVRQSQELLDALKREYRSYPTDVGWFDEAITTTYRFGRSLIREPRIYDDPRNVGKLPPMRQFLSDVVKPPPGEPDTGKESLFQQLGITGYGRWDDQGGAGLLLTDYFVKVEEREKEYKAEIAKVREDILTEEAAEKAVLEEIRSQNKDLTDTIVGQVAPGQPSQGLIGEVLKLEQQLNQDTKNHAEEVRGLEDDSRDKQSELTQVRNENLRKRTAGNTVQSDLRRRIDTIQFNRAEARERREPDGDIMVIDSARRICFINLLRRDRLFMGTRFFVYSLEKGGQKLDKGEVEVIEVRENNSSICAITRTYDKEWPIKVGDRIYNELYDGGRPRHIAIAGRFTGRLSNLEAAALIRSFGDFYQPKVDEKTSYVVVAPGYEEHPNYKAAQEFGVKILREPILYDYLGVPRSSPRPRD